MSERSNHFPCIILVFTFTHAFLDNWLVAMDIIHNYILITVFHILYNIVVLYICREFINVDGTILMFDSSKEQTLYNILSDKTSKRSNGKCWIKEVDYRASDDKFPVKILG